jgi:hypothetical protein
METTYAKLSKPAGLSQTGGVLSALIDESPTEDFHAKLSQDIRQP